MSSSFLKNIHCLGALILCLFFTSKTIAQKGDFIIDSKTSKAIPRFIGEVIKIRGNVVKTDLNNSKSSKLTIGGKISKNTEVRTGARSFVKFRMIDDSLFDLGPNSKIHFESFEFETKENRSATVNLVKGKLRSLIINKLKSDKKIIFKTQSASMGVRGTEFLANVIDGPASLSDKTNTQILVLDGKLEVTPLDQSMKSTESIELSPGKVLETYRLLPNQDKTKLLTRLNDVEMQFYKKENEDPEKIFKPFLEFDSYKDLKSSGPSTSNTVVQKNEKVSDQQYKNILKNLTAQKMRKLDKISGKERRKIGKKTSKFRSVMYFNKMYGSVHELANISSYSLTTIGCGHPVRVFKKDRGFSEFFSYVKIASYKGYILKAHLSSTRPDCFSKKYSRFTNSVDMSLSDLYYWGRLYDHFKMGETQVYK